MPITLEQFEQNLFVSGLITASELASFREGNHQEDRQVDAETLTRQLVQAKRLTKYQAARIYQGKPEHLRLGEYDVLEFIASGGMGRVYKGVKRSLGKVVAVKILHPDLVENESALKRFRREVKVAARLEHKNIVMALDADSSGDAHFLVMEFVDGRNLAELQKIRGRMSVEQAIDCIEQACRGLEYAHRAGVIHRDIKPANLMLDRKGCVKILDLGLARLTDAPDDSTELALQDENKVAGTFDYMSPEQALNSSSVDERSDIYSLGCTLYTLLTGKIPYKGKTPLKKIAAHKSAPIPSLGKDRDDIPRDLDRLCRRMMAKVPSERPSTTTKVIELLRGIDHSKLKGDHDTSQDDSALSMFFTDEQTEAIGINQAEPWKASHPKGSNSSSQHWREPASSEEAQPPEYEWPRIDIPIGTIILFGICGVVAVGALALLMAVIFS